MSWQLRWPTPTILPLPFGILYSSLPLFIKSLAVEAFPLPPWRGPAAITVIVALSDADDFDGAHAPVAALAAPSFPVDTLAVFFVVYEAVAASQVAAALSPASAEAAAVWLLLLIHIGSSFFPGHAAV